MSHCHCLTRLMPWGSLSGERMKKGGFFEQGLVGLANKATPL